MLLYLVVSYVFIMCVSSDLSTIVYYIYTCGMVNNVISCIKYLPQIVYHYKNKSIGEWNLWNTHTDIAGGIFLIAQIFADAIAANDSTIIYSNLTKLNLIELDDERREFDYEKKVPNKRAPHAKFLKNSKRGPPLIWSGRVCIHQTLNGLLIPTLNLNLSYLNRPNKHGHLKT